MQRCDCSYLFLEGSSVFIRVYPQTILVLFLTFKTWQSAIIDFIDFFPAKVQKIFLNCQRLLPCLKEPFVPLCSA